MIKIYWADINDFSQADYVKQYTKLDDILKKEIDAKIHSEDKMRSLAGYILLFRGAAEIYGKTAFKMVFNEHGKPLVDFCYFNISHSKTRVVCAFSQQPVGVDIQYIETIKHRESYRFFNRQESDYVNQFDDLISQRFIEIFTKKEAAVKMLGVNFANAGKIDTFSDDFVFETQISGDFIMSICTKRVK